MKKVVSVALSGIGQVAVSMLLILMLGPWMAQRVHNFEIGVGDADIDLLSLFHI